MRVSWILIPGILLRPGWDGQGQALEQGEIDMHVEQVGLKTGQSVGHRDQLLAQGIEILQAVVQAQILESIDADLQAQKGGELFIHPRHQAFAVDPQPVMTMIQLFQHAVQLAPDSFVFADTEDRNNLVGGEPKQSQVTGAFEIPPEQEITAVFDLVDGIVAPQ